MRAPVRTLAVGIIALAMAVPFWSGTAVLGAPVRKPTPDPKAKKSVPRPTAKPTPKPAPKKTSKAEPPKKQAAAPEKKEPVPQPVDPELAKYSTVNVLGMRFVRFGELEVSIWPTRVQDYASYVRATGRSAPLPTGFAQTPTDPVVNVTWRDATRFCQSLTESERLAGRLPANREYRLPTDREWSAFAGLGEEPGATPEERDMAVADVYPWGSSWPPPPGAGNFAGEESGLDARIAGYRDLFPFTAPVGSFSPNGAGLFDLSGNVSEWCADRWNKKSDDRVLRGASWFNGGLPMSMLLSSRVRADEEMAANSIGFRVVIAPIER